VLSPREFTTRVGGLFLFVHDLVCLDDNALALGAKLPGSAMIPAGHALRASLALKTALRSPAMNSRGENRKIAAILRFETILRFENSSLRQFFASRVSTPPKIALTSR
jgi:hypothetical protein